MSRLRAVLLAIAVRLVPESDEEAVFDLGLVGLVTGLALAGAGPLTLIIPSSLLILVGLGFNLRRR